MAEEDKTAAAAAGNSQPGPGQVITPGAAPPPQQPVSVAPQAITQAPGPQTPPAGAEDAQVPQLPTEESSPAAFAEEGVLPSNSQSDVSWTASEFVAHEKSAGWYLGLGLVALAIAVVIYLLTKDLISTIVVLVGALALGVFGARKPHALQYRLDGSGITIGQKHYSYEAFRSFAIVPEGAFSSIVFMPLKRFAPLMTIYYAPEDEDKIVDLLADRLPFEEHKLDAVDSLMRRIRF